MFVFLSLLVYLTITCFYIYFVLFYLTLTYFCIYVPLVRLTFTFCIHIVLVCLILTYFCIHVFCSSAVNLFLCSYRVGLTDINLFLCSCRFFFVKQLMTFHFGGHWFINPLEVMFTSAVGFGEHHFLGVDKSQCPPYEFTSCWHKISKEAIKG
jgi:hypothetical protein